MSGRFGPNTGQVERFIAQLYHLRSSQWDQVRNAVAAADQGRDRAYASALLALKRLVAESHGGPSSDSDISRIVPGARPEQQNIHRAAVHSRITCTEPIRLPDNDRAVSAAVNAASALAAREWFQNPRELAVLYAPFEEVIPLHTLD